MKLRAIFIVKKEKTMKELPKTYEPRDVEDRLYKFWVDNGYFHAERDPDKKPFTIVMPPPNVTGQLHMGHAMDAAMQDVLIRVKRMQGYSALWIPGVVLRRLRPYDRFPRGCGLLRKVRQQAYHPR